jgi:dimethylargininase
MQFRRALVRLPGETYLQGLSTFLFGKPDYDLTLKQHETYRQALVASGLELIVLEALLEYPDSTFVEDTAVVTKEFAVITRPGAPSREGEVVGIAQALQAYYDRLEVIQPPGTLDGGDICQADNHFFIGLSERTNEKGAGQLAAILEAHGCTCDIVDTRGLQGVLHLKSGMSYLGDGNLVIIQALKDHPAFAPYYKLVVLPEENYAANCIRVNEAVLVAAGFPVLAEKLDQMGYSLIQLEVSEFRKMDGGLSCLSLRF